MNDADEFKARRKARIKHEIVWWIVFLVFVRIFVQFSWHFIEWLISVLPESLSIWALSGIELVVGLVLLVISLMIALKITHILLGTLELEKVD